MKKALAFICLFIPFLALTAQTADIPAVSRGNLQFYVDHAGFQGKEGKTYEEFYLMVMADQIKYKANNNRQTGSIKISFQLLDDKKNTVIKKDWITEAVQPDDTTGLRTKVIYDQWTSESLSPGVYSAALKLEDENSSNSSSASFMISVPSYEEASLSGSQIEFVSGIGKADGNKTFLKGNSSVIPSPSRRFGILNPVLYLYYELYNVPSGGGENLTVTYSIKSQDGRTIKSYPSMKVKKNNTSAAVLNGVSVSAVPTGVYEFVVTASDSASGQKVSFSRNFEVIQMDYARQKPVISEEEAEVAGRILKYIATPEQYRIYEGLNLTGKAQFLVQYWKQNDPTPETDVNELLDKIQQRYNYANQNFGWGRQEGWATDRGRILIKYGTPDDIERHVYESDTVPYEIWVYNREKSYIFVFADERSDGHYKLIHSSKDNEVHNENWMEQLRKL
ncbi:MAG TPA: GWxTD domain-containing protein [Ignavibacteriales bacterium]|nr:GWxTD domain-containing protein [Ignavibacteriales bacterium]